MGIQSVANSLPATNIRYSAFLGMLYVSNDTSEDLIRQARNLVGEADWKKGFQGNRGDSPSAKALTFLKENGLTGVRISGELTSARVVEREADGLKHQYLTVGMKDADGRYYLSVDLGQSGAQMLARKLVNAEVGVPTEIGMFATYGQKEGATRAYADHGATLKQNGVEVKTVDPKAALQPMIEAAMQALEAAGISREKDKETYSRRRASVELDFHLQLMQGVAKKFSDFYAQRELQNEGEEVSAEKAAA